MLVLRWVFLNLQPSPPPPPCALRAMTCFLCSVSLGFGPRFSAPSETFPGCQEGSASMLDRSNAMACFVGWPPPTFVTSAAMSPSDKPSFFCLLTVISAHAFAWAQGGRGPSLPDTHHSGPLIPTAGLSPASRLPRLGSFLGNLTKTGYGRINEPVANLGRRKGRSPTPEPQGHRGRRDETEILEGGPSCHRGVFAQRATTGCQRNRQVN